MERAITGFHPDDDGEWVAELACGHNQHVRHRPPFQVRPWVVDDAGRAGRIGAPLDCPLCDRAELPDGLLPARTSPTWDEHTVPPGLLRRHRVAPGTWAVLRVHDGRLGFRAATEPPTDRRLAGGDEQAIPPDVLHEVKPMGPVRFALEFLTVVGREPAGRTSRSAADVAASGTPAGAGTVPGRGEGPDGGDPACWSSAACPECGEVVEDRAGPHRHEHRQGTAGQR